MTGERAPHQPPPRPAYGRLEHDGWLPPAEPAARRSLADELEPGKLREELGGAPAPVTLRAEPDRTARFSFTGNGAEYFRIWVVNVLLTLATLGIYSAWAKVRKVRYFWQNTQLEGHVFDYHGDPRAILIGRVIALLLVLGYTFAFDISATAGLVMVALLCVAGPWLFMRAQRFRLVNSSWRGLRFGFEARAVEAYRVVLPPLAIWFSGATIAAVASDRIGMLGAAGVLSTVMFPWMHHRLKAYQHRRARYGGRTFDFLPATRSFYGVYFFGVLLAMIGGAAGAVTLLLAPRESGVVTSMILGGAVGLFAYLVAWPYFAARLQVVVWSHTRLGDVRFSSAIAFGPLFRVTFRNVLLTIVTVGLYWPFAAIALARYRIECMRIESSVPLSKLAEATVAPPGLAAGDAALDAFGLDIGL